MCFLQHSCICDTSYVQTNVMSLYWILIKTAWGAGWVTFKIKLGTVFLVWQAGARRELLCIPHKFPVPTGLLFNEDLVVIGAITTFRCDVIWIQTLASTDEGSLYISLCIITSDLYSSPVGWTISCSLCLSLSRTDSGSAAKTWISGMHLLRTIFCPLQRTYIWHCHLSVSNHKLIVYLHW